MSKALTPFELSLVAPVTRDSATAIAWGGWLRRRVPAGTIRNGYTEWQTIARHCRRHGQPIRGHVDAPWNGQPPRFPSRPRLP